MADAFGRHWGAGAAWVSEAGDHPPEDQMLHLDSSLARVRLGWRPRWRVGEALERTVAWYRAWHRGEDCRAAVERDISAYEDA